MKYSSSIKITFIILYANLATIFYFAHDYCYIKENSHILNLLLHNKTIKK